jgi:AcrR family transcriptional regulator
VNRPTSPTSSLVTTAELRVPTQLRGTKRVEAILDAAADLVREVGVEGITVQILADRAQTSKGSLYHFFPDVPAVLRALAERHLLAIRAIVDAIVHDESLDWQTVPADQVVARVLTPLDYLEENCDLLAIVRAPGVLEPSVRTIQPMRSFVEYVLGARYPQMDAEHRTARAAMIVAVIDGVVTTASRGCSVGATAMRRELEYLLATYVSALD